MDNFKTPFSKSWAIILGGSSGFGFAAAEKLASHGMNIAVMYRETAIAEKPVKERLIKLAEINDVTIIPFNINALDTVSIKLFIEEFAIIAEEKHCVKLLLHSIARGNF